MSLQFTELLPSRQVHRVCEMWARCGASKFKHLMPVVLFGADIKPKPRRPQYAVRWHATLPINVHLLPYHRLHFLLSSATLASNLKMGDIHVDKTWNEGILKEFASYSFVFVPTFTIFAIESVWSLKASYLYFGCEAYHKAYLEWTVDCVDMASCPETSPATPNTEEHFTC